MMSAHRLCGRFNQSQLLTNLMTTVVNQASQLFHRHAADAGGGRIVRKNRRRQLAPQGAHVTG
jgi:hypothetical protein